MEKILVCVNVPAIGESFDIFVPSDVEIGKISLRISEGIKTVAQNRYEPSGLELVIDKETGRLLNPVRTFKYYGICDGTQLMLI